MNVRNLETLLWVSRLGGVGAAARHLNVSQPAVTRRINELEAEIGSAVLRRTTRGVQLTPTGRACTVAAERIVDELGALRVSVCGDRINGRVRIGVGEVVALTWLQELIRRLALEFPGILLELDVDLSAGLVGKLARGEVDLAVVPGPIMLPGVVRRWVWRSRLSWMALPRAFRFEVVTPALLARQPIITLSPEANVNVVMEDWFNAGRSQPSVVNYCNSLAVIAHLVRSGMGLSMLPEEIFGADVDRGTLCRFPTDPAIGAVDYWLAYPRSGEMALMERIGQIVEKAAAGMPVDRAGA